MRKGTQGPEDTGQPEESCFGSSCGFPGGRDRGGRWKPSSSADKILIPTFCQPPHPALPFSPGATGVPLLSSQLHLCPYSHIPVIPSPLHVHASHLHRYPEAFKCVLPLCRCWFPKLLPTLTSFLACARCPWCQEQVHLRPQI